MKGIKKKEIKNTTGCGSEMNSGLLTGAQQLIRRYILYTVTDQFIRNIIGFHKVLEMFL